MSSHPSCDHLGQTLSKLSILECTENNSNGSTFEKVESLDSIRAIVAQVNHRGLGVKIETHCLRDSDLIPRHSFLSTTFSTLINGVLNFMCVCVFSGG